MTISEDDRKAFAAATRGVRRIERDPRIERSRPKPKAVARHSRDALTTLLEEAAADPRGGVLGEEVGFRRPRVSERTFRMLRRGTFSIEDEVDLHGLRRHEARIVLQDFIAESVQRRFGCVRVIHGKGTRSGPDGPVLKAQVQLWLSRWDAVLAFTTAGARHGGTGAVYVLLDTR